MKDFHKYPKIHRLGAEENIDLLKNPEDDIIIEEKIDGANFRFYVHSDKYLIFGSHSNELEEHAGGNWRRCIEYLKEKSLQWTDNEWHLAAGFIFYGENCVKHSIDYDWTRIPPYLGFDIMNASSEKFHNFGEKRMLFGMLGLECVPYVKTIKAKDFKAPTDDDVPSSIYRIGMAKAEGIVMKNYSHSPPIMAKYVTERFKEVNKLAFGEGKKFAKDDTEFFVAKYCTNGRIDKIVFKLVDSGEKLDMPMMSKLPSALFEDIWEENWKDIINSKKSIDLRKMKGLIGKRCLAVLQQMMVNQAINSKVR